MKRWSRVEVQFDAIEGRNNMTEVRLEVFEALSRMGWGIETKGRNVYRKRSEVEMWRKACCMMK